jgi:hypothetical protein
MSYEIRRYSLRNYWCITKEQEENRKEEKRKKGGKREDKRRTRGREKRVRVGGRKKLGLG